MLPLGPPATGNSPYSSTSAFAGNPLLISLERLAEHGWMDSSQLAGLPREAGAIDYEEVFQRKLPLIVEAAQNFLQNARGSPRNRFERFCAGNPGGWKTLSCSMRCVNATTGDAGRSGRAAWPAAKLRRLAAARKELALRWTSAA